MLTKEKGRSRRGSGKYSQSLLSLLEDDNVCHSLQFLQAGNTSCSAGRYDDPKSPELLVTHPPRH